MKQSQLFKVHIYLQHQLRIRAHCHPWGKATWTRFLLLNRKPLQLNTLSAWVLVARMQKYFLAGLFSLGNCGLLGLHQSKGFPPSSRAGFFLYLQILVLSINDLLSIVKFIFFLNTLISRLVEVQQCTLGFGGPLLCWGGGWLRLKSPKCPVSCLIADHSLVLSLRVRNSCQEMKIALDVRVCLLMKSSRITSLAM